MTLLHCARLRPSNAAFPCSFRLPLRLRDACCFRPLPLLILLPSCTRGCPDCPFSDIIAYQRTSIHTATDGQYHDPHNPLRLSARDLLWAAPSFSLAFAWPPCLSAFRPPFTNAFGNSIQRGLDVSLNSRTATVWRKKSTMIVLTLASAKKPLTGHRRRPTTSP
jgi:hypothetical protein